MSRFQEGALVWNPHPNDNLPERIIQLTEVRGSLMALTSWGRILLRPLTNGQWQDVTEPLPPQKEAGK